MKRSTSPGKPSREADARGASSAARLARSHATAGPFAEPVGPVGDAFEREADRIANAVVRGDPIGRRADWAAASAPDGAIQRKCAECEEEEDEKIRRAPKEAEAAGPEPAAAEADAAVPESASAEPEAAPAMDAAAPEASQEETPAAEAAPMLLVEDDSDAGRGQMRKSEFMAALRAEVCAAVDAALSGTGRDSQGCPWVEHWLGYYEGRSSAQIERALRRYAPEAAAATAAQDYIQIVAARVGASADTFASTGQITGVPEDLPDSPMPGGGVLDAVGGMFFKARRGGAREANPASVRAELGGGQSLPSGLRTRMESAFGADFGGVRLHSDAKGHALSDRLNARAFTVGQHVAFGPGEFRPGTIAGDALIAHELAHVVQQGGASDSAPVGKSPESTGRLEADADRSAVAAVSALWAGRKGGMARLAGNVMPGIRSGLRVSRCSKDKSPTPAAPAKKGTWTITQNNTDGSATTEYASDVKLIFDPNKTAVNCSEIAFVQNVRTIDPVTKVANEPRANFANRMTGAGWTIDRIDQRKLGWYGYENTGSSGGTVPGSNPSPYKPAEMTDRPAWNVPKLIWDFETCAICKTGVDVGTVYSCFTWGFDADAANKVTSHATAETTSPSADFTAAVKKWNDQAVGDAAKRNHPDQQQLGPFK